MGPKNLHPGYDPVDAISGLFLFSFGRKAKPNGNWMYHISFRRVLFYFIFVNPIIMAAVMFPGLLAGAIATVDNTTAALQTLVFCYFLGVHL